MFFRFNRVFHGFVVPALMVAFGLLLVSEPVLAQSLPSRSSRSGNDQFLKVGDRVPDFELPVQGGEGFISLDDLVKEGPVVVVVLRGFPGYQCGICNRQVGSLLNRSAALDTALGNLPKRVVLVYPGPELNLERHAKQFVGSKRIPEVFVMVRDPGMEMVSSWGLRWDARNETAYPATYVIGSDKRVRWSKVSKSHGGRASTDEVIRAVKQL